MGLYLAHGPEIYPKAHKNPRAFSYISGPIYLEFSIQCPCGVGLHQIACETSIPKGWPKTYIGLAKVCFKIWVKLILIELILILEPLNIIEMCIQINLCHRFISGRVFLIGKCEN